MLPWGYCQSLQIGLRAVGRLNIEGLGTARAVRVRYVDLLMMSASVNTMRLILPSTLDNPDPTCYCRIGGKAMMKDGGKAMMKERKMTYCVVALWGMWVGGLVTAVILGIMALLKYIGG